MFFCYRCLPKHNTLNTLMLIVLHWEGLRPTPVKYVDKFTVWASQCITLDHPRPAVMTYDALLCTVMTYATANSLFGRCNALLQHLPAKRAQKHGSGDGLDNWLKSKSNNTEWNLWSWWPYWLEGGRWHWWWSVSHERWKVFTNFLPPVKIDPWVQNACWQEMEKKIICLLPRAASQHGYDRHENFTKISCFQAKDGQKAGKRRIGKCISCPISGIFSRKIFSHAYCKQLIVPATRTTEQHFILLYIHRQFGIK